ncbi:bifunctional 4-hydroxy-2-oxoglutarate aldolase/2-dehydro-3-deoxy-phosphogluconate aldolase [Demequina sp. NBRC 110052]|uniref:bifunctional 4-hydroxy-2-oxoglutarate aldolase/2-dehydro-3-deoxy-phosphogluconate aldolase n=1 Tax=Demequina sp. NBRC 110052 TaxID=1570341 RepID=UPI0027D817EA|nr:bifunctional 4-hydroxy-2-oxoglutarate aldolase/2-dehydro-3-deoxy-phosphogluconate aldolase [Demequina sp. NBRC 110052]
MNAQMSTLVERRIVPVVVLEHWRDADPLGAALVDGGLPVAEVTLRTKGALEAIRALAARGDLIVGAGTVTDARQVDQVVAAGASFVVSPGLSSAVVERCRESGVSVIPGAVTATEVQAAIEAGLDTVKFFPAATSGGPAAIRALSAPFAGVSFMPTGGISPANLQDYLSIPAVVAAGGSWMVSPAMIAAGDFAGITEITAQAIALAQA